MHRMLFNTGVRPWNHADKKGKLIVNNHEVWVSDVLHIEYFLDEEPKPNYRIDYLQPSSNCEPYQVAIKIVGGGMMSEYAIFTVLSND